MTQINQKFDPVKLEKERRAEFFEKIDSTDQKEFLNRLYIAINESGKPVYFGFDKAIVDVKRKDYSYFIYQIGYIVVAEFKNDDLTLSISHDHSSTFYELVSAEGKVRNQDSLADAFTVVNYVADILKSNGKDFL